MDHTENELKTPPFQSTQHDRITATKPTETTTTGSFFADATLDLDTAHDIADTPEATKPPLETPPKTVMKKLEVPNLGRDQPIQEEEQQQPDEHQHDEFMVNDPHEFVDEEEHEATNNNNNSSNHNNNKERRFSRITGERHLFHMEPSVRRRRPPIWPRDIPWMVSFLLVVPTLLIYFATRPDKSNTTVFAQHPISFSSLHAITWTILFCVLSSRWLYRSGPAGSDGDAVRQSVAITMTRVAPTSILVYAMLGLFILIFTKSTHRLYSLVPLLYSVRDVYSFRRWNRRSDLAGSYASRIASFQAHVNMGVDILSRSLRRASFYRVLAALITCQVVVLLIWRWAILGALSTGSFFNLCLVLVLGKWATATTTRVLTYVSSAGVMSWCSMQATHTASINNEEISDDENQSIPEAYATVDASVYQSVLVEDVLDDDSVNELEHEAATPAQRYDPVVNERITVKAILLSGLLTNFGSMAHCGLLGGLAQFVWSWLRRLGDYYGGSSYYQTMGIGSGGGGAAGAGASSITTESSWQGRILLYAKSFVRTHSDLAMCHVAMYHKGYVRASRDVLEIIEGSNMEPILHEDITTHMCTCIGGSITGMIVLISSYLLIHQKKSYSQVTDMHVVESMLLSFVLSYSLIFTVMEPLRAAIKAVYVSFAQNPRCLSQAYPLIYHRLTRLSESRIS